MLGRREIRELSRNQGSAGGSQWRRYHRLLSVPAERGHPPPHRISTRLRGLPQWGPLRGTTAHAPRVGGVVISDTPHSTRSGGLPPLWSGPRRVGLREVGAGEVTGDDRDSLIFRVELDSGVTEDFRWRDLRPPLEW